MLCILNAKMQSNQGKKVQFLSSFFPLKEFQIQMNTNSLPLCTSNNFGKSKMYEPYQALVAKPLLL